MGTSEDQPSLALSYHPIRKVLTTNSCSSKSPSHTSLDRLIPDVLKTTKRGSLISIRSDRIRSPQACMLDSPTIVALIFSTEGPGSVPDCPKASVLYPFDSHSFLYLRHKSLKTRDVSILAYPLCLFLGL